MHYSDRELLRLIPRVLRARDFHLYLENGKRLTDLWLAGGRSVLGHKPPRVLSELKNAAERGLFTPLPHPMERRILKALGELFPGKVFRIYTDKCALQCALSSVGKAMEKKVSIWRPFVERRADIMLSDLISSGNVSSDKISDSSQKEARILIPVLPWPLGPEALVLDKDMDASFPVGEIIPPVLLAPATRALYDLLAAIKDGSRISRVYPKIEKAIKGGPWRRRGIYLTIEIEADGEKYANLFRGFLEGGFLIPPSPAEPLILPASMSDGEEAKLAGLLKL